MNLSRYAALQIERKRLGSCINSAATVMRMAVLRSRHERRS
jgi:hypothetical protein